jgi:hypothetical protein
MRPSDRQWLRWRLVRCNNSRPHCHVASQGAPPGPGTNLTGVLLSYRSGPRDPSNFGAVQCAETAVASWKDWRICWGPLTCGRTSSTAARCAGHRHRRRYPCASGPELSQRVGVERLPEVVNVGNVLGLAGRRGEADLGRRREVVEDLAPGRVFGGAAAMALVDHDQVEEAG